MISTYRTHSHPSRNEVSVASLYDSHTLTLMSVCVVGKQEICVTVCLTVFNLCVCVWGDAPINKITTNVHHSACVAAMALHCLHVHTLLQNLPVAPLYGDVQIRFADWVVKLPHYDASKWTCTSEHIEDKVGVAIQTRVEIIRSEHVRFISDLARYNNEVGGYRLGLGKHIIMVAIGWGCGGA